MKKKSGGKLCFSCFNVIPIYASRCPYCISKNQSVIGRVVFWFVLIVSIILICGAIGEDENSIDDITYQSNKLNINKQSESKVDNIDKSLKELKILVDGK